jgi:hypothetical protein
MPESLSIGALEKDPIRFGREGDGAGGARKIRHFVGQRAEL